MKIKQLYQIWILIFVSTFLSSCVSFKNNKLQSQLIKSNCNLQNGYTYTSEKLSKPIYQLSLDSVLLSNFSFQSLNVANAIGTLESLANYIKIKNAFKINPTIENRLDLIEIYQKISFQINFASLEISSIASEIDCEEERADQIASFIKNKQNKTETKLTVGTIIIGAVGAITSGVMLANGNDNNTPELIGIGTGIAEASLGLGILLNQKKVNFKHERNLLKDVWEGNETSEIFPASVWYYLNYYNPKEPKITSFRYQIVERWMNFEQISELKRKKKNKLINIYFGNGGKYTAEQLKNRADMYDQLESVIKLMKQDLKGLMLEIENIK